MHVHLEENTVTRSDCTVHTLSWMGKVPDVLTDDEGWKLNRLNYYQEGWLATGSARGIVGVTFTACHCKKMFEGPPRTNFNLRGHRNEVIMVKWNEPYQKLATCDATGVIFVWIKHEGRWSIELINDRNSQVTDFAWSHDGRMALICYLDGFVLVGSVAGQRYWSSMLNLDSCTITCGVWAPDDQKVMFSTSDGQLIVMSSTGAMLSQVVVADGADISSMAWSCEKFVLTEQDAEDDRNPHSHRAVRNDGETKGVTLGISFRSGVIHMMSNYDDVCPIIINTGLTGVKMEWSNDGEILAVCGFVRLPNLECCNCLMLYSNSGNLRYSLPIPVQGKAVSCITWGHNDKRLFLAIGCHIYTAWVTKRVSMLQSLCRLSIHKCLKEESRVNQLPLPGKLRAGVAALSVPTIKGFLPTPHRLREFVCLVPPRQERLFCTMLRHGDENSGDYFTLYLEYLGGLIPLLKGKRASKIRPEFVVYDPKIRTGTQAEKEDAFCSGESSMSESDPEEDMVVDGCGSPRMQRRRRRLKKMRERMERRDSVASQRPIHDLMYDDNMPETHKLVEVTSNIWGTRFRLLGVASWLPSELGQVLYKTSLLHLQPRQMTVDMIEMNPSSVGVAVSNSSTRYHDTPVNQPHDSEEENSSPATFCDTAAISTAVQTENSVHPTGEYPLTSYSRSTCPRFFQPVNQAEPACNVKSNPPQEISTSADHPVSCVCPYSNRPEHLSHMEISSLDASPPQRRSPSFKGRALSPAEQPFTCANNTLVDGPVADGERVVLMDMLTDCSLSKLVKVNHHPNPSTHNPTNLSCSHKLPARTVELCDSSSGSDSQESQNGSLSTFNVMQMAAKKLEESVEQKPFVVCGVGEAMVNMPGRHMSGKTYRPVSAPAAMINMPRWADKACQDLKYIDDENEEPQTDLYKREHRDAIYCKIGEMSAVDVMQSAQGLSQLDSIENITDTNNLHHKITPPEIQRKRVFLAKNKKKHSKKTTELNICAVRNSKGLIVSQIDKKCLGESSASIDMVTSSSECSSRQSSVPNSPVPKRCPLAVRCGSFEWRRSSDTERSFDTPPSHKDALAHNTHSASLPTSPVRKIASPQHKKSKSKQDITKSDHRSPLRRKHKKNKNYNQAVDSSDDEMSSNGERINTTCENYKNLETFQKAQLNKKLRKVRTTKGENDRERIRSPVPSPCHSLGMYHSQQFVMHNKAPMWNENSQVYQLDFGGRVTQESAKNFQIDFRGKQVMQFGRIDTNAYTLDFQYPFTAVQAFAVALANVTQRLK